MLVFVTGASAGIGAATVRAFAGRGDRVLAAARSADRLAGLAAEFPDGRVRPLALDVTEPDGHERAFAGLPEAWRAVDVAVLNAGLARNLAPVWENTPDEVDDMVDTNVKGVLHGLRAVVPGMLARGRGHIVGIGSTAGHAVYAGGVVYCATKHALLALMQGLKVDLHGTPLRVTTVSPGLVETEFSRVRFPDDPERADAVYADTVPLTPDDIAEAVVYAVTAPPRVNVVEVLVTPRVQSGYTQIVRGPAADALR